MTSYYELNCCQFFSFPHDDADRLSDDNLWIHWLSTDYFPSYCLRKLNYCVNLKDALAQLKNHKGLKIYAVTWMRLKFLCEVLDPCKIIKKINRKWKIPLLSEGYSLLQLNDEEITTQCLKFEHIVNKLGLLLHDCLLAAAFNKTLPELLDIDYYEKINTSIQSIREKQLDMYVWSNENPHLLLPFAYCTFIVRALKILS
jgi:hypothetical protein